MWDRLQAFKQGRIRHLPALLPCSPVLPAHPPHTSTEDSLNRPVCKDPPTLLPRNNPGTRQAMELRMDLRRSDSRCLSDTIAREGSARVDQYCEY
jgi:hypothetical protein